MSELPFETTRELRAPRERVFDAFVVPELRSRWWFPEPGMTCPECEIDARVGGVYRIAMHDPRSGKTYVCTGRILELIRPERLVFTWIWDHERAPGVDPEEITTQVTVSLRGIEGGTSLHILHERFHQPGEREGYGQGWEGCLQSLERSLSEDGDAG